MGRALCHRVRLLLDESAIAIATRYWARHLGCEPGALFAAPMRVVTHGQELAGYDGVFALFRGDATVISIPESRAHRLRSLMPDGETRCTPELLTTALAPVTTRTVGPAFLGYTTKMVASNPGARLLKPADAPALRELQESCDAVEWEHGGSSLENPCSGVFADGRLVSLASYEIWGGEIAHISIVSRPESRGRGFAKSAVAHLGRHAVTAGLLPQYRTLESNLASLRIAEALGFVPFARSLAFRLGDR